MKRFKFSAESVLRHKVWLEKESQRMLGLEINILQQLKETLESLKEERLQLIGHRRKAQGLNPESHLHYIHFDNRISAMLHDQTQKIGTQAKVVKEKLVILNGAVKERKKVEKLKEREAEEYQKLSRRKETAKMDEVSSGFYTRLLNQN